MDGPAYTKPPRDVQRGLVDNAFKQVLQDRRPMVQQMDEAQQLKGSLFDTPAHAALRQESGADPSGGMKGILVPKGGAGKGFSPVELEAQRLWGKYWPKILEAFKNDQRPGGKYILDLVNRAELKGETIATFRDRVTPGLITPIQVRLNPKTMGMETGPHEASHAFAYRRNPVYGGGNLPGTGGMEVIDPAVQDLYHMIGGNPAHAATYFRADEAAKRMGLVPTRGASLKDY